MYKFDDVHCLAAFLKEGQVTNEAIAQTVFVDYNNAKNFVGSDAAWFVTSPQLKSPMASNAAAFATKEAAEKKLSEVNGSIKKWNELVNEL